MEKGRVERRGQKRNVRRKVRKERRIDVKMSEERGK